MNAVRNLDIHSFTVRRLARPGGSVMSAPMVVSCNISTIERRNLSLTPAAEQDMVTITGCKLHANCKGHHMTNVTGDVFMIPYGFAKGDETMYSDAAMVNKAVMSGEKGAVEVANFCFKRIGGKSGIARKGCNSARPTNTLRFVASPTHEGTDPEIVFLPTEVFEKGSFMFMNADGRFTTKALAEGDVILVGRCPTTSKDNSIPVVAMKGREGEASVRVAIDFCDLNNLDFDGDELWFYVPGSDLAVAEATACMKTFWDGYKTAKAPFYARMRESARMVGIPAEVDSVICTTMPLEDMGTHAGGRVYDSALLKTKSWREMGRIVDESGYWKTWVLRSMNGIVNTTMSKHGIGKPYVDMRTLMMMGTIVTVNQDVITITCRDKPMLPIIHAPVDAGPGTCPSALAKMMSVMYQEGIDAAKHGMAASRVPAALTLVSEVDLCYAIMPMDGGTSVAVITPSEASVFGVPYTKLSYIASALTPEETIEKSLMVVCIVESVDRIELTVGERLMAAFFFAFMSARTHAVVTGNPIDIMLAVGADWFTSFMCSDVRWIRDTVRNVSLNTNMDLSTDVSSILGSIMIGNMPTTAPLGGERAREQGHAGTRRGSSART
jgi:hypothetical protein